MISSLLKLFQYSSIFLLLSFSKSTLATISLADVKAQCQANGFDYQDILTATKNLQQGIKTHNKEAVAELFNFPIIYYSEDKRYGDYLINTRQEFIKNYDRILSPVMQKEILTGDNTPFCNSQGASISGGVTFDTTMRIYNVIYTGKNPLGIENSTFGFISKPITNLVELQKFLRLLKNSQFTDSEYKNITIIKGNDGKTPVLYNDEFGNGYDIYQADINNDGQNEYVMTISSGTVDGSDIYAVFQIQNDKLIQLDYSGIIQSNLGVGTEQWYDNLANPFIFKLNNKYYIRYFDQGDPPALCTYIWQSQQFTFVSGNSNCYRKRKINSDVLHAKGGNLW